MNDTLESSILGEDQDELEEEAQEEVNNVLYELTGGTCAALIQANWAKPHLPTNYQAFRSPRKHRPTKTKTWNACRPSSMASYGGKTSSHTHTEVGWKFPASRSTVNTND